MNATTLSRLNPTADRPAAPDIPVVPDRHPVAHEKKAPTPPMDAPATSPRHRGLFTPPEGSSLFIARFSDGATRIELEAPTALILARWVAKLGTRSGQAEVVSLLAHSYGVHLSDVSPQARTLAEAGLDGGPPPGGLHVHLARDPDVVLSVETALSLVALLRCFERVMGPLAAADVLEAVAETIND